MVCFEGRCLWFTSFFFLRLRSTRPATNRLNYCRGRLTTANTVNCIVIPTLIHIYITEELLYSQIYNWKETSQRNLARYFEPIHLNLSSRWTDSMKGHRHIQHLNRRIFTTVSTRPLSLKRLNQIGFHHNPQSYRHWNLTEIPPQSLCVYCKLFRSINVN
jgi:predicted amidophosphoribosyltransferase